MPPSEHELRLRERLGRLRNMPLLGGAKLSGDLQRLQKQLDRLQQEATDEEIDSSITNICRCGTFARVRRAIHAVAEG